MATTINQNTLDSLADYMNQAVWEYELRMAFALEKIDHMRCPLRMADANLYNDMLDALCDYCVDNDLSADDFDLEDIYLFL